MSGDNQAFLDQVGLSLDDVQGIKLSVDDLRGIHAHYTSTTSDLEDAADYLVSRLRRVREVHSVRARVKSPAHVVRKIVRKQKEGSYQDISVTNYHGRLTDLVGVRALHLLKNQWAQIDQFVGANFRLHEGPIVKLRAGDDQSLYPERVKVEQHQAGYRSIHYVLELLLGPEPLFAELQVRTIFEEGWSEVDHTVRYPEFSEDPLLIALLSVFNRLAGAADEMTLVTMLLADVRREYDEKFETVMAQGKARERILEGERDQAQRRLRSALRSSSPASVLETLERDLDTLRASNSGYLRDRGGLLAGFEAIKHSHSMGHDSLLGLFAGLPTFPQDRSRFSDLGQFVADMTARVHRPINDQRQSRDSTQEQLDLAGGAGMQAREESPDQAELSRVEAVPVGEVETVDSRASASNDGPEGADVGDTPSHMDGPGGRNDKASQKGEGGTRATDISEEPSQEEISGDDI